MITKTKFNFYIAYLLFLAIWLGAAFHDSFSSNYTWFVDPINYIKYTTEHITPGVLNPWPFSTLLLIIFTIITLFLFRKYKGPAKNDIIVSILGTLIILTATAIYFVPTLGKIFGRSDLFNVESLITMSRTWVVLNILRFGILVFLFIFGLRGLAKLNRTT